MILAIDFDGTVVEHKYPDIGKDVPHAVRVLKRIISNNHQIIIWTMRCDKYLDEAVDWYKKNGIPFTGANINKSQNVWTNSPKVYAHRYIDDAAVGCPLITQNISTTIISRAYVDWLAIEKILESEGLLIE